MEGPDDARTAGDVCSDFVGQIMTLAEWEKEGADPLGYGFPSQLPTSLVQGFGGRSRGRRMTNTTRNGADASRAQSNARADAQA
jgi:hypothetical protein